MNSIYNKLHHVCIVVHDIDKTQDYYESIGIGPWEAYPPLTQYNDLTVPDRDSFMQMQYRVCNFSNVQLQLCQPGPGNTPQRKQLDEKGEGVFQIGFEVPDADAAETKATKLGLEILMRGRREDKTGFTYFDTVDKGGINLLIRATPGPQSRG